jgi:YkoY family integral membrane protein
MLGQTFFHQTFDAHDLIVIGLLIVLEGVLSIDNALVLGLLAKRLPKHQQNKALTYGLVGAFVFRIIAIATASYLLQWRFVKLLGGGYLLYVALKHFFFEAKDPHKEDVTIGPDGALVLLDERTRQPLPPDEEAREILAREAGPVATAATAVLAARKYAKFWPTVFVIELTDIAFAIDSILAAIALVGSPPAGHPVGVTHPKLWVVVTGGMLGVILMRFAAVIFIKLLDRFPRFETSAYLLVAVIGLKLTADWGFNSKLHPHRLDFHDMRHPAFWVFWVLMIACFMLGFLPKRGQGRGFPVIEAAKPERGEADAAGDSARARAEITNK